MRQKGVPARLEQENANKVGQLEVRKVDNRGSYFEAPETVATATEAASSHASTDGEESSRPENYETMGDIDVNEEPWGSAEDQAAGPQTCSHTEEITELLCPVNSCGHVFNNRQDLDQHIAQHDNKSFTMKNHLKSNELLENKDMASEGSAKQGFEVSDGDAVDHRLEEDSHRGPNVEEEMPTAEATNVKYYCNQPECGYKTFKSRTGWTLHMREHRCDYKFRCEQCDFGCFTERRLKEHVACKHTGVPVCFCSVCEKGFVTFTGLRHHESLHKNDLFPCDYCEKVYKNKKDKEKHKRTHQVSFACKVCSATFVWKHHAVTHLKVVHRMLPEEVKSDWDKCVEEVTKEVPKIIKKPDSGKGASPAEEWLRSNRGDSKEEEVHKSDGKVEAIIKETGRKSLRLKRKLASSKRTNEMTRSNKNSPSLSGFGDSNKVQAEDALSTVSTSDGAGLDATCGAVLDLGIPLKKQTRYECTVEGCGKTFKAKKVFKLHMKGHNECNDTTMQQIENMDKDGTDNENKIACPVEGCGKKFKNKKVFKLHMQGHNDNYPFRCEVCNFGCFQQRKLREHTASVHIGIPVCFCPVCGKEFLSYSGLNRHKYTHREEVYKCDVCDKEYKNAKERDRHRRSHEQRYACPICGKRFGMKHHLKSHYRYMHSEASPGIYPSYMHPITEGEEQPISTFLDGEVEKLKRQRRNKKEDDRVEARQSSTWSQEYPSMISIEGKTHFPSVEGAKHGNNDELSCTEPELQAAMDNLPEAGNGQKGTSKGLQGKGKILDKGNYIPSGNRKGIFMDIFKLMSGSKLGEQNVLEGESLSQDKGSNSGKVLIRPYHPSRENSAYLGTVPVDPRVHVDDSLADTGNPSCGDLSPSLLMKSHSVQHKLVLSGTTSCSVCGKKFLSSAGLQRHKLLHFDREQKPAAIEGGTWEGGSGS